MATKAQLRSLKRARAAKRRKHHPRAAATTTHKRRRRRHTAVAATTHKRRRRRSSAKVASSAGRKLRQYRRNPDKFSLKGFFKQSLMPSAIGAGGALGLDLVLGYLPIPDTMKTGAMRPIVRIAGAVGIGMLAGMIAGKRTGEQVGAGALTVVLYDTLKGYAKTAMPTLPLSGVGDDYPSLEYVSPAINAGPMGEYVDDGMGLYVGEGM